MRWSIVLAAAALLAAGPAAAASLDDIRSGNDAYNAGRVEEAVEAFSRAVAAGDLEPEALAITFNNRGVAYAELGDFDRAISDYTRALGLKPNDAKTITNLRIAYLRRAGSAAEAGRTDAARADYARAIEAQPAHPTAWLRRGQLHAALGELEAAKADLEKARELDPGSPVVTAALGQLDEQRAPVAQAATPSLAVEPANGTPVPSPPVQPPTEPAAPAAAEVAAADPAAQLDADQAGRRYRAIQSVSSRSGPGNDFPRVAALQAGQEVEVEGERLGWFQVRLPGGGRGYIYKSWLRPVAP